VFPAWQGHRAGNSTTLDQIRATRPVWQAINPGRCYSRRRDCKNEAQGNEEEDEDMGGFFGHHPGLRGMMERGYGHHGRSQGRRAMSPTMMHIIFSLMDADGDGKLTLQEWQAAHERIFKAMDTNHDGIVTMEEMVIFMRGHQ
jgi:EF hand